VKDTFKCVALLNTAVMLAFTLLAQWKPDLPMRIFTQDPATIEVGATFLRLVSLNLVAQGLIFISSSMFQGLGNTKPVLISSGFRVLTYSLPVIWLSTWPQFRIEYIWYLSNVTTTLQALLCMWLLRREFVQRLKPVVLAA
jgi:Na+-driven multidrug efflux pump